MPNAIVKGDIDAYAAWEMHVYNGQKELGDNSVVFIADKDIYREYQNVYANKHWLEKNGTAVKKFLRALIKAEKYIIANPDEALDITARETGFTLEALNSVKDNYKIGVKLDIGPWVAEARREGNWINSQKPEAERKPLPDYRSLLNDKFLREIDSLRVKYD